MPQTGTHTHAHTHSYTQTKPHTDPLARTTKINDIAVPRDASYVWRD